jgi:CRISPR-associated protein Cas5d
MNARTHVLEVWGELACFSRPEMKVERFSYPVITPSAARGIFDAIYAKPAEFRWQVDRVDVLSPPSYIALRRNEMKGKASTALFSKWAKSGTPPEPLFADSDDETTGRTQRQTMALRDVRYRLYAHIEPWSEHEARRTAFDEQFRRRASKGKCFFQPYFGCREFPAWYELLENGAAASAPYPLDLDIGLMVYDVFDLAQPGSATSRPYITLFHASVVAGVMKIPPYNDPAVIKLKGGKL